MKDHFDVIGKKEIKQLFKEEKGRMEYLSFDLDDLFVDLSKNFIDRETLALFESLAEQIKLGEAKEAMFNGEKINETENRAVLHIALRNLSNKEINIDGNDVMPSVHHELEKIKKFTKQLHSGELLGYTGKKINRIVNIGIGGSDLGPFMVVQALKPYWKKDIQPYFVSNVDANHLLEALESADPETTLFIIASKTFTTQETMTNANSARDWFLGHAKDSRHIARHFVAVSTNAEKVSEFGIDLDNMFEFWDWVGGRYSLWSAIGLSIACSIGYENFESLLRGAEKIDKHFKSAPLEKNIPTLLAFLGVWYNNFFGAESHAILPYDHHLSYFGKYLQQGDMESNGKYVARDGEPVEHQTGPIIWGEPGTNSQHAFFQLIHQGTKMIPCDFIAAAKPSHDLKDHQEKLIANFIAQTEALMNGKGLDEAVEELRESGKSEKEIKDLAPYKVFQGNRPTNTILLKELTPQTLGSLIAIYEHKIFVQGIIWNIYSFDQWGVELGKQLAGKVLKEIKNNEVSDHHDGSTRSVLEKYLSYSRS